VEVKDQKKGGKRDRFRHFTPKSKESKRGEPRLKTTERVDVDAGVGGLAELWMK